MDADHRHELKENDLAEFIAHFGVWWSKYGFKLLAVVVLVVGVYTVKRVMSAQAFAAKEEAWSDLATSTSPDGYNLIAQTHSDPAVRALAYLRGADLLLAKAMEPAQPDTSKDNDNSNADHSAPATLDDLNEAAAMYEQVAKDSQAHLAYRLNALLGLGAVTEQQRDWDRASQHYQQAVALAGDGYARIAAHAQARSEMLSRLRQPVVFGASPSPIQPSEPTPESGLTVPLAPPMPGIYDSGTETDDPIVP